MENKVVEVIDALCGKFGIAIDWTSENIVPYLQDLMEKSVKYEFWTSIVWVVVFGIFMVIGILAGHFFSKADFIDMDFNDDFVFVFLIYSVPIVLFIGITISQCMDIVTCLTFPEKIFLDTIQSMGV